MKKFLAAALASMMLIGGAALDAGQFVDIINAANQD